MYKNQANYYSVLGEFLVKFSEMEMALIAYCSKIKYLSYCQQGLEEFSSYVISKRLDFISKYINEKLPDIKNDWDKIKWEISQINEDRRYLIHGLGNTGFYQDTITTFANKKGKIIEKKFSHQAIGKLIDRIDNVNTGNNGIRGEFLVIFTTKRYDLYNDEIENARKICYRINGVILTKFKG